MSNLAVMPIKDYVAVCDVAREKTGTDEAIISENLPSKVEAAYEAGKKAEYDAFWDMFQDEGNRTNYANAFGGLGWTDTLFKPKYNMQITDSYMMFRSTKVTDLSNLSVLLDFSKSINMQYMFQWAATKHIGVIDMSYMVGQTQGMFGYTYYLHTIDKIIVTERVIFSSDAFMQARLLANITFEGVIGNSIDFQWCPLSRESITNIVEHLSPTVTGQTVTFKKSAKEAAFTNDEWAELIATKPNWTFALL